MAEYAKQVALPTTIKKSSLKPGSIRKTRYEWAHMDRDSFLRALPSASSDYTAPASK